jgi:hypothetical protein
MEIRILGNQSAFLKGKKENVLINPTKELLSSSKYQSRIVIYTSDKYDVLGLDTEPVVIRGPGEYEIGGVEINGYNGGNGDTMYVINHDGVIVGVLGELDEPLSDKRIEKVNAVDVLLAPAMIGKEASAKLVLEWAKKWGANYLIPTGWIEDSQILEKFLDIADQEGIEQSELLKVDKDNLPDGLEVKVLKKV